LKELEKSLVQVSMYASSIVQQGPIDIIQRVTEGAKQVVGHLCLLSFVVGIALYVFPDPTGPLPAKGKNLMRTAVTAQALLVFSDMIFEWIVSL
jgi:hypothetical protein